MPLILSACASTEATLKDPECYHPPLTEEQVRQLVKDYEEKPKVITECVSKYLEAYKESRCLNCSRKYGHEECVGRGLLVYSHVGFDKWQEAYESCES